MSKSIFQRWKNEQNDTNTTYPQAQSLTPAALMEQYKAFKNDKTQIYDLMLKNGQITQAQYNDIKGCQDPAQAIQYLLNAGAMDKSPLANILRFFGGGRK